VSDGIVREAVVLAGGEATRLGELAADVPKCLQPVAGRPFIDHLLWQLRRYGVRRVVLATGRLHAAVEAHVGDGSAFGLSVTYALEPGPFGTAGAVALGAAGLSGDVAYVCNGDSLFDCNLTDLARRLRAAPDAEAVLALREVEDVSRFGAVVTGDDGRVADFAEKGSAGPGVVNGGVYCMRTALLHRLEAAPGSLERDVFPALARGGRLLGAASDGFFVDIGLPESLAAAQSSVAAWRRKPCAFLDRDGVINQDADHVHAPSEFRFMPGMPQAIRALNDAGWLVIVVTNQAGIGRGLYTEAEFEEFTAWIDERLAEGGAHVDATYHCPHHPTAGLGEYRRACECRKPAPGMLLRAIAEWGPDVGRSFMLGDNTSDMEAAAAAGVRGVMYTGGDLLEIVSRLAGSGAGERRAHGATGLRHRGE
jgi:D,D-heptose 1,7-bisphosphate phosphatase